MIKDKIIADHDVLFEIVDNLKIKNSLVFTNGCFDILHAGHVLYLEQAKLMGNTLLVAINSDDSVRRLKGENRPIQSQKDRAIVLAALESIDYITFFTDDTPLNLIKKIMPDVLVKGGDWAVDDIVGHEIVIANQGRVESIPFVVGKSTSDIEAKILKSNIK